MAHLETCVLLTCTNLFCFTNQEVVSIILTFTLFSFCGQTPSGSLRTHVHTRTHCHCRLKYQIIQIMATEQVTPNEINYEISPKKGRSTQLTHTNTHTHTQSNHNKLLACWGAEEVLNNKNNKNKPWPFYKDFIDNLYINSYNLQVFIKERF